jgi:hypothetical protein
VRELSTPIHLKIGVSQTSDIMVQSKVYVDDKVVVINDNSVVDRVNIFFLSLNHLKWFILLMTPSRPSASRSYLSGDSISCNIA